jgi:hypothetical protein
MQYVPGYAAQMNLSGPTMIDDYLKLLSEAITTLEMLDSIVVVEAPLPAPDVGLGYSDGKDNPNTALKMNSQTCWTVKIVRPR